MSLDKYKEKRNFKVSPEPSGKSHSDAISKLCLAKTKSAFEISNIKKGM